MSMIKDLGLQVQSSRREADEHNRELKAQIKGVNAHLNDIDVWKRSVDSQLGHLASIIPRAAGNLPGKTEENPRNHIAAVTLRSGKATQQPRQEHEEEVVDPAEPTQARGSSTP